MNFYAHSRKSSDKHDKQYWQPLHAHLKQVAEKAALFAKPFNSGDWAYLCGLLHDLGKYSHEFQKRLAGGKKVDHSLAGALEALQLAKTAKMPPFGILLAHCISGHHTGLASGSSNESGSPSLEERLSGAAKIPDYSNWRQELSLPAWPGIPPLRQVQQVKSIQDLAFPLYLWGKMLYSCLVDADFLDTESYMAPEKGEGRGCYPSLDQIRPLLDTYLAEKTAQSKPSPLNDRRAEVLADCRKAGQAAQGIFSLTVPTGGGKTLSSLAFALEHAKTHGLERVIYVIPYTSIIEQTADVFRKALGPEFAPAVVEHHCNAATHIPGETKEADDQEDSRTLAWENWDAPILVTTAVQFFESLFASRSSQCRKLHNIAGSVVILDEAQTLPVPYLEPCLAAIKELAGQYRASIVLCTATQPQVGVKPWLTGGLEDVREIVRAPADLFQALKRVSVEFLGKLEDEELVARLMPHGQALCIVNTKAHARALCEHLQHAGRDVFHLSTWMYPAHRKSVLENIRERLSDPAKPPCLVVATSLIEAGVDISFPVVFRAVSGLDSIAQAAGRCNREWEAPMGRAYVFEPPTLPRGEQQRRAQAGKSAASAFPDVLSPEAVAHYFDDLFSVSNLDSEEIMRRITQSDIKKGYMPYRSVAKDFTLIEESGEAVFIARDEEAKACLAELESAAPTRALHRRVQQWSVSVPEPQWQVLLRLGIIRPVGFAKQWHVLESPDLYNDTFGLDVRNPVFMRAESGIF